MKSRDWAKKLQYVSDPGSQFGSSDIDTVRLPSETLKSGVGDCDDLTAVFASAFETAGVETRIITTPGHILLAVDSGLPEIFGKITGKYNDRNASSYIGPCIRRDPETGFCSKFYNGIYKIRFVNSQHPKYY